MTDTALAAITVIAVVLVMVFLYRRGFGPS
jgi:hypothetical protein